MIKSRKRRLRGLSIAAGVAIVTLTVPLSAVASDPVCVRTLSILENMFGAYKARFANDRCKALKMAVANRAAMLNVIHRHPNDCGLEPSFIAIIERQRLNFTRESAICH